MTTTRDQKWPVVWQWKPSLQLQGWRQKSTINQSRQEELGWESRRHVGNMSARQLKVGTFGQQAPDEPTQFHS
jgi:hypothetical protein